MGLTRQETWHVINQITDSKNRLSGSLLLNFKEQLQTRHQQSVAKEDAAECLELLKQSVRDLSIDLDKYT